MESHPTSVSVVMPCYNGMPYLPTALDSALAQTSPPCEIIVVDDGSTDASAQVVRTYEQRDTGPPVRLIQQANAGEPAARNTGIQAAKGAWVAALDTDDWWEPTKLEKQLAAAEAEGDACVLVHTGYYHHFPDGKVEAKPLEPGQLRTGWVTQALLTPVAMGHPSIMVRKDALDGIGGYDPAFKQACDIDLYWRLSVAGTFAFVAEHLLHYRIHPGQMSARAVEQIAYHLRAIRSFIEAHPSEVERIGADRFQEAMACLIEVKLESLYWRRRLPEFRKLLDFAAEQGIASSAIRQWRGKANYPDWLIHAKDRLLSRRREA